MNSKVKVLAAFAVMIASPAWAQTINHSADKQWSNLIDSAKSEGWRFKRSCYPHPDGMKPYCTLTMESPPTQGKIYVLMEAYGVDDRLLGRSVCETPSDGIAMRRHCYYVDRQTRTDELYDTDRGEWEMLGTSNE